MAHTDEAERSIVPDWVEISYVGGGSSLRAPCPNLSFAKNPSGRHGDYSDAERAALR
jgi:hypothetical protein